MVRFDNAHAVGLQARIFKRRADLAKQLHRIALAVFWRVGFIVPLVVKMHLWAVLADGARRVIFGWVVRVINIPLSPRIAAACSKSAIIVISEEIGFFVAWNRLRWPPLLTSPSGIKHPISERRLRQPPYQCAGFNIETLLVGSPLFKEMASQTGLNNSTLVAVGWVLFGGSFHHLPVYHNVILLHWKKTSIVPHDSRDYLIHLFYFFFNFN